MMKTRAEVAEALLGMIRPLKPFYSRGRAWLQIGSTAAHYGEKAARMEGFSRILWGLGPLWAAENQDLPRELQEECKEWLELYRTGIIHGTNPQHEEYWGSLEDYDQKMVEMAALVTAISLSPDKLWEPLQEEEKERLYRWLNQINQKKVHPNNWRFFRILVNMAFQLLELPWSEGCMEEDWEVIDGCYCKDGWYYDGNPGQVDYYIPFAMHFYGLLYAGFMKEKDPARAERLMGRGSRFSEDFVYWFAADGNEIPFGRSLTYRFAHGAFFGAMGFAGEPGVGYGLMKTLALRNLTLWLKRPIFDSSGILSIGYGYPNLFMSERYNGPGSPYWSFKAFFMLALPQTHAFWQAEEADGSYEPVKRLEYPHMLVTHDKNHHVLAFTAGQHCQNHGTCEAKYEKFVYSNQFAFSVPRGHGLREGAFDSTLAVSPAGEECYRVRYGADDFQVTETAVYVDYHIGSETRISSLVMPVPKSPWHIRVHHVCNERAIDIAEGGFAIDAERCFQAEAGGASGKFRPDMVKADENGMFADFPWGISGVVSLSGGTPALVQAFPNTNLLYNLSVIPTIQKRLEPGEHWLMTCVLGDRSEEGTEYMKEIPQIRRFGQEIRVSWKDWTETCNMQWQMHREMENIHDQISETL